MSTTPKYPNNPDTVSPDTDSLQLAAIAIDDQDSTAPDNQDARKAPAGTRGRCLDAAWGYKTSKSGERETGFGFHQHTVVRTADPNAERDVEPKLVEGLVVVPANADVVDASLEMLDRIQARRPVSRLIGDLLYTNLKATRWAVPLAQRGITQSLAMRSDSAGVVDINGAHLQFGWMHCPSTPMDQRPLPKKFAHEESDDHYEDVDAFKTNWAFDRKESGLGIKNRSTKWICPAMAGRAGCWARGTAQVAAAQRRGLPVITPPEDWAARASCTNKTMDFTADPANPHHQRKLMQTEYVGTRRWRREQNRRTYVEGVFGILKNPSRQRMRRGQNRLPGLAMANIINALKAAVYNEEELRSWHARTGRGPADHPLLQDDAYDWGFTNLTEDQATDMDRKHLAKARVTAGRGTVLPLVLGGTNGLDDEDLEQQAA